MNITTKFALGQPVWFMHENAVHNGVITRIFVNLRLTEPQETKFYHSDELSGNPLGEFVTDGEDLFATKEELLASL